MIASGTCIARYTGLLLDGHTTLHGIANGSTRVDYFRNQYHRVLLGGCTILHGITNYSLRVKTSSTRYILLLLGGHTILPGIANISRWLDCFRNQYCRERRVTPRWAYDFVRVTARWAYDFG